jgi:hypothetical protein
MTGAPAPELQQLKQRIIDAGGKLTKASIQDDAITDLFTPLLGTGEITLQNVVYDFPDDTTLAITAKATLFKKPQIELNIQFTLSGKQLLLTINSNPDALAFTLTEMADGGLLPKSMSFTHNNGPPYK